MHAGFLRCAVTLAQVARPAGSSDIFPNVHPTARTRHDMINRIGGSAAVLASMSIARKHCSTGQRCPSVIRNFDHITQPNNEGGWNGNCCCMHPRTVIFHDVCLVRQHQTHRPTGGYDTERLVCCVEDERATHGSGPPIPVGTVPVLAPLEIIDHVVHLGLPSRISVLRDRSKRDIGPRRDRKVGAARPPARWRNHTSLTIRNAPQIRSRKNCDNQPEDRVRTQFGLGSFGRPSTISPRILR